MCWGKGLRAGFHPPLERDMGVLVGQGQREGAAASDCDPEGPQTLQEVPRAMTSVLSGATWSVTWRSALPSPAPMAGRRCERPAAAVSDAKVPARMMGVGDQ